MSVVGPRPLLVRYLPLYNEYQARRHGVPIVKKGGVIFFKRYHVLPRVYINRANIHTKQLHDW